MANPRFEIEKLTFTIDADIKALKSKLGQFHLSKDGLLNVTSVLKDIETAVQALSMRPLSEAEAVIERLTKIRAVIRAFPELREQAQKMASEVSQAAYKASEDAIWFVTLGELSSLFNTPKAETPFSAWSQSTGTRKYSN